MSVMASKSATPTDASSAGPGGRGTALRKPARHQDEEVCIRRAGGTSKSCRLTVMFPDFCPLASSVGVHAGEEEGDFHGSGLGSVGAMDGIGVDGFGEIGSEWCPGRPSSGSVAPISSRILGDGALAFEALDHDRPEVMNSTRS